MRAFRVDWILVQGYGFGLETSTSGSRWNAFCNLLLQYDRVPFHAANASRGQTDYPPSRRCADPGRKQEAWPVSAMRSCIRSTRSEDRRARTYEGNFVAAHKCFVVAARDGCGQIVIRHCDDSIWSSITSKTDVVRGPKPNSKPGMLKRQCDNLDSREASRTSPRPRMTREKSSRAGYGIRRNASEQKGSSVYCGTLPAKFNLWGSDEKTK